MFRAAGGDIQLSPAERGPPAAHAATASAEGMRRIQAPRQLGLSPFDGSATRRTCPNNLS